MSTKSTFFRYRLYLCGVGGLTLLAWLFRTLALCLHFDADIGYFQADAALPVASRIIEVIALLAALALPFLIRRGELPRERAPLSMAGLIAAGISALLFLAAAIYLLINTSSLPAPAVLVFFAMIFSIVGAAYFALQWIGKLPFAPLCGYGVILAAALMLSITYFDRYTPMNAPHKTSLHLCMLAIMLYMLYELRAAIGRPLPRALATVSAITFILTATVGGSNLIAFVAGVYNDPLYLMGDLLAVGFAFYVASRAVADLLLTLPERTKDTDAAPSPEAEEPIIQEEAPSTEASDTKEDVT